MRPFTAILSVFLALGLSAAEWQMLSPRTPPTKRHEAAFTELNGKFYNFPMRRTLAIIFKQR